MKKMIRKAVAFLILIFGLITLFMSSSVILDMFNIREKEGHYVPFVVWANFACSLLYLLAGSALIRFKKISSLWLFLSVVILAITFIALQNYIHNGGIYEKKTVTAMIFRILLSAIFTITSYLFLKNKSKNKNETI
ncbi:MAG: hypothetical protein ABS68_11020 [Niastella sp. SCN 39-18]|nr:MAG: hypothetical protein ABS68_11020 [Niastella sp. SCN 39-18]OJW11544.1 MAG: hypothetical protein BGO53_11460 [Sphingobacteriales bacterium 39-19]